MDGLQALVEPAPGRATVPRPFFVFRGKRGDLVKLLWWSVLRHANWMRSRHEGLAWPSNDLKLIRNFAETVGQRWFGARRQAGLSAITRQFARRYRSAGPGRRLIFPHPT
jgi:transposase